MMGTSGALTSTCALSMPRPANADNRCSTVETRAVTINKSGAELGVADVLGVGTDFGGRIEIGTSEHDAGVRRRGPQGHQDLLAGVQADALGADGVFESALSEHLKLSPARRCNGARVAPPCPGRTSEASGSGRHSDHADLAAPSPQKGRYRNTVALFSLAASVGLAPQKGRNIQHILGFRAAPCRPSPTAR